MHSSIYGTYMCILWQLLVTHSCVSCIVIRPCSQLCSSAATNGVAACCYSYLLCSLLLLAVAVQAAQEFDELKKAYAILSDKSARGALDDYLE